MEADVSSYPEATRNIQDMIDIVRSKCEPTDRFYFTQTSIPGVYEIKITFLNREPLVIDKEINENILISIYWEGTSKILKYIYIGDDSLDIEDYQPIWILDTKTIELKN
jgi:hypothetical protein